MDQPVPMCDFLSSTSEERSWINAIRKEAHSAQKEIPPFPSSSATDVIVPEATATPVPEPPKGEWTSVEVESLEDEPSPGVVEPQAQNKEEDKEERDRSELDSDPAKLQPAVPESTDQNAVTTEQSSFSPTILRNFCHTCPLSV